MTSDAKVGLLLGLVIIFVVAFVINGLPHFNKNTNSNELTTMDASRNESITIAEKQRQLAKGILTPERITTPQRAQTTQDTVTPEITTANPDQPTTQVENETVITNDTSEKPRFEIPLPQATSTTQKTTQDQVSADLTPDTDPASKTYTVCQGDSLSKIAMRCYGSAEGKKQANIDKIFQANAKTLKSSNQLHIGMKLAIPTLPGTVQKKDIFSAAAFEKVESISPAIPKKITAEKQQPKNVAEIVVKDGDSLWKIASKYLGNGNRYTEIIKANSNILSKKSPLVVGMKLKMPGK